MNDRLALARHLAAEGFCVIPLVAGGKKPARKWKRFQKERPTDAELVEWFQWNDYEPAIVTGQVSGITVIDCDSAEAAAKCQASGIRSLITQRTTRGIHLVFRHAGERNTVFVNRIHGADRRGEGGYIRAYPDCATWTRDDVESAPRGPVCLFDVDEWKQPPAALEDDEQPVWDEARGAWRLDWTDLDGEHSVWLDPVTLSGVAESNAIA